MKIFVLSFPFCFGVWSLLYMANISSIPYKNKPHMYHSDVVCGLIIAVGQIFVLVPGIFLFLDSWKTLAFNIMSAFVTYILIGYKVRHIWENLFLYFERRYGGKS